MGNCRYRWLTFLVVLVGALALCGDAFAQAPPDNNVTYFNDPDPSVTTTPVAGGTEVVLRKELGVYGNYGVADRAANILYTGEVATWHFALPPSVDPTQVQRAFFRASLIADDHYGVSLDSYNLAAWTNRQYLGNARADLPHGSPFGSVFNNWVQRDYDASTADPPYSITLFNTSGVGNWFAVDWIELHLIIGQVESRPLQVLPTRGGNAGYVTATIQSAKFRDGAVAVRLSAPDSPDIIGINPTRLDPAQIVTTFDLRDAAPGMRDLVIAYSDGSSETLSAGFEVVAGGGGRLAVNLLGPSVVRVGHDTTYLVIASNVGLNDIGRVEIDAQVLPVSITAGRASPTSVGTLAPVAGPAGVGISPGGTLGSPFRVNLRDCGQIIYHAKEASKPDPCEPIKRKIRQLKTTRERLVTSAYYLNVAWKNSKCDDHLDDPYCQILHAQIERIKQEIVDTEKELADAEQELADCEGSQSGSSLGGVLPTVQGIGGGNSAQGEQTVCPVFSWDPNDLVGVEGVGLRRYVRGVDPQAYTIFFENIAAATAPAQEVTITNQLDRNLDWSTFSLDSIRFGAYVLDFGEGVPGVSTLMDLRPAMNLLVRVEAVLNPVTGILTCKFSSLDPDTGRAPADPFAGFLPPNRIAPEGEGSVSYTINPRGNLRTGTEIHNRAVIVFDTNPPILTPEWLNTIDRDAPVSQVLPLKIAPGGSRLTVQWLGADEGSGIQDYTIYVSDNSGPFRPRFIDTTKTQAVFTGQPGHTYAFYSTARDSVGNVEPAPSAPEGTISVPAGSIDTLLAAVEAYRASSAITDARVASTLTRLLLSAKTAMTQGRKSVAQDILRRQFVRQVTRWRRRSISDAAAADLIEQANGLAASL